VVTVYQADNFEMYVKYCENKPRSEALLATSAGEYFDVSIVFIAY